MQAYRLEIALTQNNTLTLHSLPFKTGEVVEVIVLPKSASSVKPAHYSLRGLPITYHNPFEPVALNEWEVVQ